MDMNARKLNLEEMEMVNGGLDVIGAVSKIFDVFNRQKDNNPVAPDINHHNCSSPSISGTASSDVKSIKAAPNNSGCRGRFFCLLHHGGLISLIKPIGTATQK